MSSLGFFRHNRMTTPRLEHNAELIRLWIQLFSSHFLSFPSPPPPPDRLNMSLLPFTQHEAGHWDVIIRGWHGSPERFLTEVIIYDGDDGCKTLLVMAPQSPKYLSKIRLSPSLYEIIVIAPSSVKVDSPHDGVFFMNFLRLRRPSKDS